MSVLRKSGLMSDPRLRRAAVSESLGDHMQKDQRAMLCPLDKSRGAPHVKPGGGTDVQCLCGIWSSTHLESRLFSYAPGYCFE